MKRYLPTSYSKCWKRADLKSTLWKAHYDSRDGVSSQMSLASIQHNYCPHKVQTENRSRSTWSENGLRWAGYLLVFKAIRL